MNKNKDSGIFSGRSSDAQKSFEATMSDPAAFAAWGGGQLAYVRSMSLQDVSRMFPDAPKINPGVMLFALLGADGSPLMLTDDPETAFANAMAQDLETVTLH